MSPGHPAGQTGVYRPVSQGFPVVFFRKIDIFAGKSAGCLRDTRPSRGFSIFLFFSYLPFLLPKNTQGIGLATFGDGGSEFGGHILRVPDALEDGPYTNSSD